MANTTAHRPEVRTLLSTCCLAAGEPGPEIATCVRMRDDLLEQIDALELPANFLDALIDQLGGPGQYGCNAVLTLAPHLKQSPQAVFAELSLGVAFLPRLVLLGIIIS